MSDAKSQTRKAAGKTPAAEPTATPDLGARRLRVSALDPDGLRRAGRRWTREPQEVEADDFEPSDLEALFDEPRLKVEALAD